MSRIGKIAVHIPAGVKVALEGNTVKVEGPKGKVSASFASCVAISMEDNLIHVKPLNDDRFANAMHGTTRAIINNMVKGVSEGFTKSLEITGVGFKAILKGKELDLKLGQSHPILYPIPEGITVKVTDETKLEISGADKRMVGQVASDIKRFKPVEPYKGKGVHIVGEYVLRKEGKKTA
ncbi:MAG: 50S ribosomal protein L6 [Opitutales bacterium]|nr:50S ribosomal protein L6 [Opitutales bacterium]